jgi:ribosomal protein S18 acetylase RimI-like enzyme
MKIRKAKPGDKKQFIQLASKADQRPEYWSEPRFIKFIKEKGNIFLFAEEKGRLVGYIGLKEWEEDIKIKGIDFNKFACVAWIAVLPESRKKGVGSKLLKEAEKYARKWKKEGIWLDCRKRVLGFYKKNDYKIKGYFIKEYECKKFRKYVLEKRIR